MYARGYITQEEMTLPSYPYVPWCLNNSHIQLLMVIPQIRQTLEVHYKEYIGIYRKNVIWWRNIPKSIWQLCPKKALGTLLHLVFTFITLPQQHSHLYINQMNIEFLQATTLALKITRNPPSNYTHEYAPFMENTSLHNS